MSDHLRRQIADLRAMVEALQPAHRAEDYLRDYFGDPKFAPHLVEIVAHLLSDTPVYSFVVERDPDEEGHPMHHTVMWYDRSQRPILISYTKFWRRVHGDLPERDATDTPPVADAADGEPPATIEEPRLRVARSDLAVAREYGHPEPSAAPADPADGEAAEREAELAAEIERLRDAIAALDGETAQRTLPTAQDGQRPGRAPISEFESKMF